MLKARLKQNHPLNPVYYEYLGPNKPYKAHIMYYSRLYHRYAHAAIPGVIKDAKS